MPSISITEEDEEEDDDADDDEADSSRAVVDAPTLIWSSSGADVTRLGPALLESKSQSR